MIRSALALLLTCAPVLAQDASPALVGREAPASVRNPIVTPTITLTGPDTSSGLISGMTVITPYVPAGRTLASWLTTPTLTSLLLQDSTTPMVGAGLKTEVNNTNFNIGVNAPQVGAVQVDSIQGGFIRFTTSGRFLELWARPANGSIANIGYMTNAGAWSALSYQVNGVAGVTCAGVPTSNFQVTNGIVTRC